MKKSILIIGLIFISYFTLAQSVLKTMLRLPDTGETTSYTNTFGEDADFTIFSPYFIINGNGTVTDTITGLMWQQTDGGEMTIENAAIYCDALTLGGFSDWRLPSAHEGFSILNHQCASPPLDPSVFTVTMAEYWWTGTRQVNDSNMVWVTNAGGGIGNHPKNETVSAGGSKKIHVRAVRDINSPSSLPNHFTDNGNGTITDNVTNLIWQKLANTDTLTWEQALNYADTLSLNGNIDWRLPNIKELQSINDENLMSPSVNPAFFSNIGIKKYWSSTTLPNQTDKAWYLSTQFGITTYDLKTVKHNLICVRGDQGGTTAINEITVTDNILIYPNPAISYLKILCPVQSEIEISDIRGQVVKNIYSEEAHAIIDISGFAKGIYLLKIKTEKSVVVKKFVKE